jgi:hypothetical protein
MLLRDLVKVYISSYTEINNHGEISKVWAYQGIAWLNIQQDIDELDRKSTGEVDYSIYKGRTDKDYSINKGDGISFTNISLVANFTPEYKIIDYNKIGSTYTYRMEKLQ